MSVQVFEEVLQIKPVAHQRSSLPEGLVTQDAVLGCCCQWGCGGDFDGCCL